MSVGGRGRAGKSDLEQSGGRRIAGPEDAPETGRGGRAGHEPACFPLRLRAEAGSAPLREEPHRSVPRLGVCWVIAAAPTATGLQRPLPHEVRRWSERGLPRGLGWQRRRALREGGPLVSGCGACSSRLCLLLDMGPSHQHLGPLGSGVCIICLRRANLPVVSVVRRLARLLRPLIGCGGCRISWAELSAALCDSCEDGLLAPELQVLCWIWVLRVEGVQQSGECGRVVRVRTVRRAKH